LLVNHFSPHLGIHVSFVYSFSSFCFILRWSNKVEILVDKNNHGGNRDGLQGAKVVSQGYDRTCHWWNQRHWVGSLSNLSLPFLIISCLNP